MAAFADLAFLFTMIVFVFAVFPALMGDRRMRRHREGIVTFNLDVAAPEAMPWHQDIAAH